MTAHHRAMQPLLSKKPPASNVKKRLMANLQQQPPHSRIHLVTNMFEDLTYFAKLLHPRVVGVTCVNIIIHSVTETVYKIKRFRSEFCTFAGFPETFYTWRVQRQPSLAQWIDVPCLQLLVTHHLK